MWSFATNVRNFPQNFLNYDVRKPRDASFLLGTYLSLYFTVFCTAWCDCEHRRGTFVAYTVTVISFQ